MVEESRPTVGDASEIHSYPSSICEESDHTVRNCSNLSSVPGLESLCPRWDEVIWRPEERLSSVVSGSFGVSLPLREEPKAWNVWRFSSCLSDSRFSMSGEIAHISKWPVPGLLGLAPGHVATVRWLGKSGEFDSKAVDCVGLMEWQELLPAIHLGDCEARVAPLPPTALSRLELLTVDLLFESEKFRRLDRKSVV